MRTLNYNHQTVAEALDERIERTTYDALGRVTSRIDARFFGVEGAPSNFGYQASLSGQVLRRDSLDAGTHWVLEDADHRPIWARDGRGVITTWMYDLLGRPLTLEEQSNRASATRDVWIYGEQEPDAQENNLRGQCVRPL